MRIMREQCGMFGLHTSMLHCGDGKLHAPLNFFGEGNFSLACILGIPPLTEQKFVSSVPCSFRKLIYKGVATTKASRFFCYQWLFLSSTLNVLLSQFFPIYCATRPTHDMGGPVFDRYICCSILINTLCYSAIWGLIKKDSVVVIRSQATCV